MRDSAGDARVTTPAPPRAGDDALVEEFARQRSDLAADRRARVLGVLVAFALAAPFVRAAPLGLAAAAYLLTEAAQIRVFAALDRRFRRALYRLSLAISAAGAVAFSVPAVLLWQAGDPALNLAAVLFLAAALINAAIARAAHLPLGAATALPPGLALLWLTLPGRGAQPLSAWLVFATALALLAYFTAAMRAHNRAQRDRARALRTAEGARAAQSRFIAAISHDMRTPLNAILGTAQNIAAAGGGGTPAQVQTIRTAAETLRQLLDGGLDQARAPEIDAAPLPPLGPANAPAVARAGPAPRDGRARVLVVDDIATNRLVLVHMLRHAGHTAREAASGEDALHLLAQDSVDLVVMDLNMPGLSGAQTVAALRARPGPRRVPVLAITADAELVRQRRALLAAGIDDLLVKPVDAGQLLAAVAHLTGLAPWPGPGRP